MVSSDVVDMHGFDMVSNRNTSKASRLFWGSVIAAMLSVALYGIHSLFTGTGATATSKTMQHLPSVRIPDVAFCMPHIWESDSENFTAKLLNAKFSAGNDSPWENSSELAEAFKDLAAAEGIEVFYRNNSMSCDSIMVSCRFKNQYIDCCDPNTTFRYLNQRDYMCIVLESVGYQNILDPLHGLVVVLRAKNLENSTSGFSKFMSDHGGGSVTALDHFNGVKVILANQFREYQTNAIIARPGLWTNIAFEQKYIRRIQDCRMTPPFATTHGCYESCFNHVIVDLCGCLHVNCLDRPNYQMELVKVQNRGSRVNESELSLCNPFTLNTCLLQYANYTDMVAECYEYGCRNCCKETVYATSATYATLRKGWGPKFSARGDLQDGKWAWKSHGNGVNQWVAGDLAYISIVSSQLGMTVETEFFIMDPVSYVSMAGGQLGLWLGWSVITILQIVVTILWKLKTIVLGKRGAMEDIYDETSTKKKIVLQGAESFIQTIEVVAKNGRDIKKH